MDRALEQEEWYCYGVPVRRPSAGNTCLVVVL